MNKIIRFILILVITPNVTSCVTSSSYDLSSYGKNLKGSRGVIIGKINVEVDYKPVYGCTVSVEEDVGKYNIIRYKVDSSGLIAIPIKGKTYNLGGMSNCENAPSIIPAVTLRDTVFRNHKPIMENELIYIGDVSVIYPLKDNSAGSKASGFLLEAITSIPASHLRDSKILVSDNLNETISLYRKKTGDNRKYNIRKDLVSVANEK